MRQWPTSLARDGDYRRPRCAAALMLAAAAARVARRSPSASRAPTSSPTRRRRATTASIAPRSSQRLEGDFVAIRAFPVALRWFVKDADDERFLRAAAEDVFDRPLPPERHRAGVLRGLRRPLDRVGIPPKRAARASPRGHAPLGRPGGRAQAATRLRIACGHRERQRRGVDAAAMRPTSRSCCVVMPASRRSFACERTQNSHLPTIDAASA